MRSIQDAPPHWSKPLGRIFDAAIEVAFVLGLLALLMGLGA